MSPCPDENTLAQFASGKAEALTAIETHLDGCDACRRAVAAAASVKTLPTSPGEQDALVPGARVGRYQVERELGRGGMGVVYMARDVTLDRRVALKLLHVKGHGESQARLLREAQVMGKLAHPNVVPVFELSEWRDDLFLVMELVNGVTLESWLKAAKRSPEEILSRFIEAGRGLAAAHAAGVVHRDFKPANVLVGLDGRVRVTDFGLSLPGPALDLPPHASPLLTRDGTIMGTPAYMAPEQLDGKPADERSDQFAFCVALTEALTGHRPFLATSWSELSIALAKPPQLNGLSRSVKAAMRRGLQRDPAARFLSMTQLLAAIEKNREAGWGFAAALAVMIGVAVAMWPQPQPAPAPVAVEADVPVVIAGVDIEEGTVIRIEMLKQRSMPRRFVTPSTVTPDSASHLLGAKTQLRFRAGDAMLWTAFPSLKR